MKTNFFIDSFKNLVYGKINIILSMKDLETSRYISLYKYHKRKRTYKEHLEKLTINKVNLILSIGFPKKVTKEEKKEIIDCTVIFLKYMTINYDYFPNNHVYEGEFNKIIVKNIEKYKNN